MRRINVIPLQLLRNNTPRPMLRRFYSSFTSATSTSAPAEPKPQEDTTHFGFTDVPRDKKESLVGEVFKKVAGNYGFLDGFWTATDNL
jgi:hypothetical protein